MDKTEQMDSEIQMQLLNEIKNLRAQIICLEQKVDNANGVLVNHINFINNVFDTIKKPLFFIMNKINNVLQIEDQDSKK